MLEFFARQKERKISNLLLQHIKQKQINYANYYISEYFLIIFQESKFRS